MRKTLAVCLVFLVCQMFYVTASAEKIFMTRNANGSIVFTDRPQYDSERVVLPQANVTQPVNSSSAYSGQSSSSGRVTTSNSQNKNTSTTRRRSCGR